MKSNQIFNQNKNHRIELPEETRNINPVSLNISWKLGNVINSSKANYHKRLATRLGNSKVTPETY